MLTQSQKDEFIHNGFLRIDHAFPTALADEARKILWPATGCAENDPTTWTQPVIRLGMFSERPFVEAANTPVLHTLFDDLVGGNKWIPCRSMGTFPVRFPSPHDPGDIGWHVDASFPGSDPGDYLQWRINWKSKGRALLMLFLFSDVRELDAPTRILPGSHLDVARLLKPAGDKGLSFMELAENLHGLPQREEVLATGKAGTVYLCHPFIAHAAQPHRGKEPRFLAQPPLGLKEELSLDREDGQYTPLEESIRFSNHRTDSKKA